MHKKKKKIYEQLIVRLTTYLLFVTPSVLKWKVQLEFNLKLT